MAIRHTILTLAAVSAVAMLPGIAQASSHREAPLLLEDPTVDATDLFAFRNGTNLDIIVNYIPFELASAGPNFYRFSDNAVYRINIDNTGDAIPDIIYEFRFHTTVTDPSTFLYNTGPIPTAGNLNVHQTYTVTRIVGTTSTDITPAANAEVAPAFVGRNSFVAPANPPTGPATNATAGDETTGENAAARTAYDTYVTAHNVGTLGAGNGTVFAGPRDDPFFIDLGAIFDLLRIRPGAPGNAGGGVDHLAGLNTHSIVLEVPISSVTSTGAAATDPAALSSVVGIWTTAHRPRVHVLRGSTQSEYHGELVQVSRLGLPLVNEVLVPLAYKDFYLGSQPVNDVANYGGALTNNLVTGLLNALYGIGADQAQEFNDIVALLSGTLIRPTGATGAITPSDTLKINLAIAGSPFPAPGTTATLGALGADTAGFPNGRRLADDVTDIELRVLGGALHSNPTGALLGDGVNQNDVAFTTTFPYIARPHEGYAQVNGRAYPTSAPR